MIIMTVKFETSLTEAEVIAVARERADQFRALPGLIQKYYVRLNQPGHFGGYYIWDSMESIKAYRESELASTIGAAYQVVGTPEVEILETLFPLRD